jgi:hypothetical protein
MPILILYFMVLKNTTLHGMSPWANYTVLAKLVETFADRGCHVVSVTDSLWPYSRLSRPEPQFFLSSSSSVVLRRLSGPRYRPISQKIWWGRESKSDLWICSQELWPLDHRGSHTLWFTIRKCSLLRSSQEERMLIHGWEFDSQTFLFFKCLKL